MAKKEGIREKIHNFNSDMEFCIYKDLCTSKDPKKSDMKKMEGIRFKTYDEWNTYIRKKYADAPLKGLREFKRFLNGRRRALGVINNWWYIFLVPFIILVLGTYIMDSLKEISLFQKLDFGTAWQTFPQFNGLEKMLFLLLVLVGVILAASPALVIIFGMFVFIWKMLSTSMENEQEAAFYDDYMEIIDEMIEDKEKTEKSDT